MADSLPLPRDVSLGSAGRAFGLLWAAPTPRRAALLGQAAPPRRVGRQDQHLPSARSPSLRPASLGFRRRPRAVPGL